MSRNLALIGVTLSPVVLLLGDVWLKLRARR